MSKKWAFKAIVVIIFSIVLASVVLVGCSNNKQILPKNFIKETNLASTAKVLGSNGSKNKKAAFSGKTADYIDIVWDSSVKFNTAVIYASGYGVVGFEIEKKVGDGYEMIYKQDFLDTFRYCVFDTVETNSIRIKVTQVSGSYKITNVEVFNIAKERTDFKTTSYITIDTFQDQEKINVGAFSVITDIILFGGVDFTSAGSITIYDKEKLTTAVENVRYLDGKLGKKFTLYINIQNPTPSNLKDIKPNDIDEEKNKLAAEAMKKNKNNFIANIQFMLGNYQADGISFDWEYPYKAKYWKIFGDFILEINKQLPNIKIASAFGAWGVKLPKAAAAAIDIATIMGYDLVDKNDPTKNHSPFYSQGPEAISYFLKAGFKKEQLHLGVPFYSRPTDMSAHWIGYDKEYLILGRFGNIVEAPYEGITTARSYNGYQMIMDKTAYAYDFGLGGMMVWHYACDIDFDDELSLFKAIKFGQVRKA